MIRLIKFIRLTNLRVLAPTLADKRLKLLNEQERGVAGETTWMIAGFKLEEHQ